MVTRGCRILYTMRFSHVSANFNGDICCKLGKAYIEIDKTCEYFIHTRLINKKDLKSLNNITGLLYTSLIQPVMYTVWLN